MGAKLDIRRSKLAIMEDNELIKRDNRRNRPAKRGSDKNSIVLEQDKGGRKDDD